MNLQISTGIENALQIENTRQISEIITIVIDKQYSTETHQHLPHSPYLATVAFFFLFQKHTKLIQVLRSLYTMFVCLSFDFYSPGFLLTGSCHPSDFKIFPDLSMFNHYVTFFIACVNYLKLFCSFCLFSVLLFKSELWVGKDFLSCSQTYPQHLAQDLTHINHKGDVCSKREGTND